ncbi:MAG: PilZ domain-containing protein [Candidatus Aminicenantes bacterium]|nr:MAG: PilZ domain-containing protein [Candidatus Aminicenantes bacterium]
MERRRSPRIPVEVDLQLWRDKKVKKKTKGSIKNLSLEGMCVETDLSFRMGSDLVLSLDLPDKLKFNLVGKIVWEKKEEKKYIYGIRFSELDINEKPKWYNFILATLSK